MDDLKFLIFLLVLVCEPSAAFPYLKEGEHSLISKLTTIIGNQDKHYMAQSDAFFSDVGLSVSHDNNSLKDETLIPLFRSFYVVTHTA
jgi:hypothetical protein